MMQRLRWLARRNPAQAVAILEAAVLLGASRLAIILLPSDRLSLILGEPQSESERRELTEAERPKIAQVRWAITGVSNRTPWTSNCLPQAVAGKYMLKRRGLDSTIYIGAAFTETKDALRAHAWLRCGKAPVTGGTNNESEFGAIASYF